MQGDGSLVTIVIPTRNRASWLPRALQSALSQTHRAVEAVVMDDGSTDETPHVVERFADPRLRYHRHPGPVGIVRNYGAGVERARGSFVCFLSDDDAISATFVSARLDRMAEDPGLVAVFSGYDVCDGTGAVVDRFTPALVAGQRLDAHCLLLAALARSFSIATSMYRRDDLLQVWPHLEESGHAFDTALNLRLSLRPGSRGLFLDRYDLRYTRHAGQTSASEDHFEHADRMYESILHSSMPPRFRAAIRRDRACMEVCRGRRLAELGQLAAARDCYRRAVRYCPTLAWAWRHVLGGLLGERRG